MLMKNALVMYDRETDSLWSHFTGEAIDGKLKGKRLEILQAVPRARWADWKKAHPSTKVLSVGGSTQPATYSGYADYHRDPNRAGVRPVKNKDDRLPPKSFVLGVLVGEKAYAVPLDELAKDKIVRFRADGRHVVAYYNASTGLLGAVEDDKDDRIVGIGDRALVTRSGRSVAPLDGELRSLPAIRSYWFAWADFYPETTIVNPGDE